MKTTDLLVVVGIANLVMTRVQRTFDASAYIPRWQR
jgi:hypothetical protein